MSKYWKLLCVYGFAPREDGDPPAGDPPAGDPPAGESPPAGGQKTFTQEDVDRIVGQRQKSLRTQFEALEKHYEQQIQKASTTEAEREQLRAHLEDVQARLRTKEQQAAIDAKRAAEAHKAELENARKEKERYQQLYTRSTIERAVLDAAAKHEAYNPSQFISLVGGQIQLVEELDDKGEKTGNYIPLAEVVETDPETKQPVKVRKTPDELIASMKNDVTTWGNLFKSNVARGIGEGRGQIGGGANVDVTRLIDEEYFANRGQIRKQLGLRPSRRV